MNGVKGQLAIGNLAFARIENTGPFVYPSKKTCFYIFSRKFDYWESYDKW